MLPPGHDAINIIPSATVGVGFNSRIKRNVTAGSKTNCEMMPIITDFGRIANSLKCWTLMSSATPNIIKAMVTFNANKPAGEKLSLTLSRTSRASFISCYLVSEI
jgi:hypothetical protein